MKCHWQVGLKRIPRHGLHILKNKSVTRERVEPVKVKGEKCILESMVVGINTKYFCIGIHQGDGHAECYDHANMSRYFDIKVMLRPLKNI